MRPFVKNLLKKQLSTSWPNQMKSSEISCIQTKQDFVYKQL